jgi:hypothetical protein
MAQPLFGVANGVGDNFRSFLEFTRQNRDKLESPISVSASAAAKATAPDESSRACCTACLAFDCPKARAADGRTSVSLSGNASSAS